MDVVLAIFGCSIMFIVLLALVACFFIFTRLITEDKEVNGTQKSKKKNRNR